MSTITPSCLLPVFEPSKKVQQLAKLQSQRKQLISKIDLYTKIIPELYSKIIQLKQHIPKYFNQIGRSFVRIEGESLRAIPGYFINPQGKGLLLKGVKQYLSNQENTNVFDHIDPFCPRKELAEELKFVSNKITKHFVEDRITYDSYVRRLESTEKELIKLQNSLEALNRNISSIKKESQLTYSNSVSSPVKRSVHSRRVGNTNRTRRCSLSAAKAESTFSRRLFLSPLTEIINF